MAVLLILTRRQNQVRIRECEFPGQRISNPRVFIRASGCCLSRLCCSLYLLMHCLWS